MELAVAGIRDDYHPYDLDTGEIRSVETAATQLQSHFDTLERFADKVNTNDKGKAKLRKARRLLTSMLATLSFFFMMVKNKVEALRLPAELQQLLYNQLIPAYYLERVADQAETVEQRHKLLHSARACLSDLANPEHPWCALDKET